MKNKITTISFVSVLIIFLIVNVLTKDKEITQSERRHLKQFKDIDFVLGNSFIEETEDYTLDQFVYRDTFRSIKANTLRYVLNKTDNNGLFIHNNKIFKTEYPLNIKSVTNFTKKLNSIRGKYLKGMKVYYAIIPDKNYYLDSHKYLKMDYDHMFKLVNKELASFCYIDLTTSLKIDSYYDTDTHWRQEKLEPVVNTMSSNMYFNNRHHPYETNKYYPFYGVSYGQAALNFKPDKLTYLTNSAINNAKVFNYEDSYNKVYNNLKLKGMDAYDVFLSGATPFITIINKDASNQRELVIFRDSFASSLAPLLIESYAKITLIDLRYIELSTLEDLITFKNQDILFLYSTLIINNSDVLKN